MYARPGWRKSVGGGPQISFDETATGAGIPDRFPPINLGPLDTHGTIARARSHVRIALGRVLFGMMRLGGDEKFSN